MLEGIELNLLINGGQMISRIFKYSATYLLGEFFYTQSVKRGAANYVNSIKGNKLNIGANGSILKGIELDSGEKCDIYPDPSRGILYCNMTGPMPYYTDKQFDVVFASHIVEHIEPEYIGQALRETERIGKEVVIVLPHPLCQGFYTMPSHKSLVYKTSSGLFVRNNPLRNNRYYTEKVELDPNIFKIYQ